jgi:hypothetical protein
MDTSPAVPAVETLPADKQIPEKEPAKPELFDLGAVETAPEKTAHDKTEPEEKGAVETRPAEKRPPNTRPMEARFHRAPQIALAIACWSVTVAIVWFWMRGLDTTGWQHVATRAVVSGLAVATALFAVLGIVFLRAAFLVRPLALAIDDRGIWFGQPDIALIPWSRVLRTEFFDLDGRRRFGVVTTGPTPRMRPGRGRTATYAWDKVDDGIRVSLQIDRLDIKEEQIARTVRWFAPPVMRVTSFSSDA